MASVTCLSLQIVTFRKASQNGVHCLRVSTSRALDCCTLNFDSSPKQLYPRNLDVLLHFENCNGRLQAPRSKYRQVLTSRAPSCFEQETCDWLALLRHAFQQRQKVRRPQASRTECALPTGFIRLLKGVPESSSGRTERRGSESLAVLRLSGHLEGLRNRE